MSIHSRRGALQGPFVRWADVAEPRPGIVVQAVRIAEGWVYMMEPGQGYVVRQQVHASEQVVQVVQGSLRLQIGSDERLLTPDDIAVVPIGTYHRGLVTTPSRIFELNTPADPKNLFDPALGEQALQYPRAGATLRTANGHVLGPFARWPRVAGGAGNRHQQPLALERGQLHGLPVECAAADRGQWALWVNQFTEVAAAVGPDHVVGEIRRDDGRHAHQQDDQHFPAAGDGVAPGRR